MDRLTGEKHSALIVPSLYMKQPIFSHYQKHMNFELRAFKTIQTVQNCFTPQGPPVKHFST